MDVFHHCSGFMKEPHRACWHRGVVVVDGKWYCRQHLPKKKAPETLSLERLRELERLAQHPVDRRQYVKTCVEEFPKLVKELIRLRG